ncbi:aldehyde oxidase GLOX-like [Durio zibethinus]|uniref:Aldehyde oxidase GLOX-like n=1 Tax=Durio zibethinus TaxID=66656 RepID=A0A6P6BG23_DURZI|nr:aldehyde oxidase GLOX-like [Durio zibethinus]
MEGKKHLLSVVISVILQLFVVSGAVEVSSGGRKGTWKLLQQNTGVVAMHMALTYRNTVIMFDQTAAGPSQHRLPRRYNGKRCTRSREDLEDWSCYAHSVEYDVDGNKLRSLRLDTDPWCSSGSFLSNGTLLQTGGYGSGSKKIRYFNPCSDHQCNWKQSKQMVCFQSVTPEKDRVIIVGGTHGRNAFSYEFVPKLHSSDRSFNLTFLRNTNDPNARGNNLYPFLHLSSDGNLFIFANRDSILFNYRRNKVIKTFPRIPGGGSRNYPSSGSSVILPLDQKDRFQKVVMVCGGGASGAYEAAARGTFLKALTSCGRMVISGYRHMWKMENMPGPRIMHDMLVLPTGRILIINGAKRGCAGWKNAVSPSLQPYLYNPKKTLGRRFSVLKSTKIARMYHSSALLLPNGGVLVAGGNPNNRYTFRNVSYPTELRLQAFIPHYMDRQYHHLRPVNVSIEYSSNPYRIAYGEEFIVQFRLERRPIMEVEYSVYAPPFTTHSISMNQRLLKLRSKNTVRDAGGWMTAVLEAPPCPNVAPPGYYLLTVVNGGIPSLSQWIRFIHA